MTAETLRHDTSNVSSDRPVTNREFAAAIEAAVPGAHVDPAPDPDPDPANHPYLDTTRLTHNSGVTPSFDVATAVADHVAWRADHLR